MFFYQGDEMKKYTKKIGLKSILFSFIIIAFANIGSSESGYVGEDDKVELEVKRLYSQPAKFPRKALRLAKDGYVLVEFDIDTDGSVIDPYVVESEPAGLFERAAMKSIRKYLYEPPVYEGVSVKVNDVQVKMTFKVQ
jgi:protein TonB